MLPDCPSTAPTVAEYVDTVRASFSKGTAGTYKSYWRLAVDRFGERPIDAIGVDDCESVVADAVERADAIDPEPTVDQPARTASARCAPSSPGPSGRVSWPGARPQNWRSRAASPIGVAPSKTKSCARSSTPCGPPARIPTSICCSSGSISNRVPVGRVRST